MRARRHLLRPTAALAAASSFAARSVHSCQHASARAAADLNQTEKLLRSSASDTKWLPPPQRQPPPILCQLKPAGQGLI